MFYIKHRSLYKKSRGLNKMCPKRLWLLSSFYTGSELFMCAWKVFNTLYTFTSVCYSPNLVWKIQNLKNISVSLVVRSLWNAFWETNKIGLTCQGWPNLVHCLFVQIKLYWNTVLLFCSHVVSSYNMELAGCYGHCMVQHPKIYMVAPLWKSYFDCGI